MNATRVPAHPLGSSSFFRSLQVQMRVIGALIMRELHTRFGRENVGYLWMVLEPLTLASAVAGLHAGSGHSDFGTDIQPVPFSICGYAIFIIFRGIFTRAEGLIEGNQPLLYHRQVTLLDMHIARALLEGAGVGLTIVILMVVACIFDYAEPPVRPLYLIFAILYMVWFSWAAGMICCAGTHDNRLAARLVHPGTYLLMPLSGGFYMLSWIPQPYRDWLWYLPMVHIFEMARYGQFANASPNYINLDYLTGCTLTMTAIGLVGLKIVRRHIHLQ